MRTRARADRIERRSPEGAAQRVLQGLGFPLPLPAAALLEHVGLGLCWEEALPPAVRALLDIPTRRVVLRAGLPEAPARFAVGHEVTHYLLLHHRIAFVGRSQWDLPPRLRLRQDREANRGAAALLFGAVPPAWFDVCPPSWDAVAALARLAEASPEASLLWFVAHHREPVWGVLCDPVEPGADPPVVRVRRVVGSAAARAYTAAPLRPPALLPIPASLGLPHPVRPEPAGRVVRRTISLGWPGSPAALLPVAALGFGQAAWRLGATSTMLLIT